MKKTTIFILLLSALILGCSDQHPNLDKGLYANLYTSKGEIILRLEMEKTPVTVANFVSLAEGENKKVAEEFSGKKYYDGLIFHRVINDFMIQGGDPTATGSGGPGYKFGDEFTDLTHNGPGILSMANAGPGTNGSQFFITHKETPWLDGKHTVFGKVTNGQAVVDSIAQNDTIFKIDIIRKGSKAIKFDASKVFSNHFEEKENFAKKAAERNALVIKKTLEVFAIQKSQATKTASGLEYFISEKGNGPSVTNTNVTNVNYSVYFTDGVLLDTSILNIAESYERVDPNRLAANAYKPITADVNKEAAMIEGFKEGVRLLNVGDKATLFLPYNLAYGEEGNQMIPARSDLIFEIEVISLVK